MTDQSLVAKLTRFMLYSFMLLAWLLLVPVITRHGGMDAFREGNTVEWLQFGFVSLAATVLALSAWRWPRWRTLLNLMAALAALAAIREQDALLDRTVPFLLGWKGPALVCVSVGIILTARDFPNFVRQLDTFARTSAFGMMWAGALTVVCAAQLIGHGELVQAVMADAYNAEVKRVVEESFEAFGYLVLLMGSFETAAQARHFASATTTTPVAASATSPAA